MPYIRIFPPLTRGKTPFHCRRKQKYPVLSFLHALTVSVWCCNFFEVLPVDFFTEFYNGTEQQIFPEDFEPRITVLHEFQPETMKSLKKQLERKLHLHDHGKHGRVLPGTNFSGAELDAPLSSRSMHAFNGTVRIKTFSVNLFHGENRWLIELF